MRKLIQSDKWKLFYMCITAPEAVFICWCMRSWLTEQTFCFWKVFFLHNHLSWTWKFIMPEDVWLIKLRDFILSSKDTSLTDTVSVVWATAQPANLVLSVLIMLFAKGETLAWKVSICWFVFFKHSRGTCFIDFSTSFWDTKINVCIWLVVIFAFQKPSVTPDKNVFEFTMFTMPLFE